MEIIKIENLNFTYPSGDKKALDDINITVNQGEFITVMGKSGCGKTTLLRMMKNSLAPFGKVSGNIYFKGMELKNLDLREETSEIGFVMQDPDNQIVTDKVWHELAFGLENLGLPTPEIRVKVAEMASFFGIENWFYKNINELSGGEKQLLNLASVMVMQPSLLILDEPTSQLDPIAADEFLKALEKINKELSVTVILSEHRLSRAFSLADRVFVMDAGKVIIDDKPENVGDLLKEKNHPMSLALPVPVKIHQSVESNLKCPLTIKEGRDWIYEYTKEKNVNPQITYEPFGNEKTDETVIEVKDLYFRYEKESPDVIKGLNLRIKKGEIFAILGGNGTGKTTALSLIGGLLKPYRGETLVKGENISNSSFLSDGVLGILPQNPKSLFTQKTVYLDLLKVLSEMNLTDEEKEKRIESIASLCFIETLLQSHPYDLSGGEVQRAALAMVLLREAEILLLDEPTKGMDAHFKMIFGNILIKLKRMGATIVLVSHDVEFCASFAETCALFFDGNIVSSGDRRAFFRGKNFYTTEANRMARDVLPLAILPEDVILALGGKIPENEEVIYPEYKEKKKEAPRKEKKKLSAKRIIAGSIFVFLFIITNIAFVWNVGILSSDILKTLIVVETIAALISFFPQKKCGTEESLTKEKKKLGKRTVAAGILILFMIPLTMFLGIRFFDDRKYYFISLLIMLETLIPFILSFEGRKPKARELIIISVLCALAVAGREAFFMLPQFKPVLAIVIIAGVTFGGETGFLVGAVTGFVSNFFFGQGPWTVWQMFALGIIGFLAGVIFNIGKLKKSKASLGIFGFISAILIYGGIMNPASVIMWQDKITFEMLLTSYVAGFGFDLAHGLSTGFFLWVISESLIEKLERVKIKYGLIN